MRVYTVWKNDKILAMYESGQEANYIARQEAKKSKIDVVAISWHNLVMSGGLYTTQPSYCDGSCGSLYCLCDPKKGA